MFGPGYWGQTYFGPTYWPPGVDEDTGAGIPAPASRRWVLPNGFRFKGTREEANALLERLEAETAISDDGEEVIVFRGKPVPIPDVTIEASKRAKVPDFTVPEEENWDDLIALLLLASS